MCDGEHFLGLYVCLDVGYCGRCGMECGPWLWECVWLCVLDEVWVFACDGKCLFALYTCSNVVICGCFVTQAAPIFFLF